jgi:hypothetical protein
MVAGWHLGCKDFFVRVQARGFTLNQIKLGLSVLVSAEARKIAGSSQIQASLALLVATNVVNPIVFRENGGRFPNFASS